MLPVITLGVAALFAACETSTDPKVASVGGQGTTASNLTLTISPNDVTISVGRNVQLATNAGSSAQLQWTSSNNSVATVSSSGLVTAFSPGATLIVARFTSDTTRSASATVNVITP